jgi:hypothetical protein
MIQTIFLAWLLKFTLACTDRNFFNALKSSSCRPKPPGHLIGGSTEESQPLATCDSFYLRPQWIGIVSAERRGATNSLSLRDCRVSQDYAP